MGSNARYLRRLRSIYRLLRLTFLLLAAEPGELEIVELLEHLVVAVDTCRLFERCLAQDLRAQRE